ncbi:sce7725 family protein [Enterobacter bugandensis]|uniref:sce7725 family protein n=1 Tax=Enterobacter bugandensis TaxID=881260 RepID=UPI0021D00C84|nr:sce7725 family protein [Enterobacter bugandensis]MCU6162926.1 sce7725 family protein [Enterobacter bugandensis]
MYFPFIRGKQFELSSLRELAPILPKDIYKPIIEPVRKNLLPLVKTIKAINQHNIEPIIIINPDIGDFESEKINVHAELFSLDNTLRFVPCIKIDGGNDFKDIVNVIKGKHAIFIADILEKEHYTLVNNAEYAIIPKETIDAELEKLKDNIVLIDDPFQKKSRNADYKERSIFSDIHTNFSKRPNVIGFSDYTIVGSEYSEAGGPAYVVTIHLSYIDDEYNQMFIRHFSSPPSNSPANPGGKFSDAISNCITFINNNPNIFDDTLGLKELRFFNERKHFPGLGQVKKTSIEHHIETLCNYLTKRM